MLPLFGRHVQSSVETRVSAKRTETQNLVIFTAGENLKSHNLCYLQCSELENGRRHLPQALFTVTFTLFLWLLLDFRCIA